MSDPTQTAANSTKHPEETQFNLADRATILGLAALLIVSAMFFFIFIGYSQLLHYEPSALFGPVEPGRGYFETALDYRERRLTLLLTYRTFLTTLGFTVGLAICAMGGLFVLRRAVADTGVSGKTTGAQQLSFAMATNSPGIVFMVAGVVTIFIVQYLTLPIGAPEIFPGSASAICAADQLLAGTCSLSDPSNGAVDVIGSYCNLRPEDPDCRGLVSLRARFGEIE